MREFCSYGPVDDQLHFSIARRRLVEACVQQVIGAPGKGGHYFTIWAPRQTGKTWLMREVCREIVQRAGEQFIVADMSMQGVMLDDDDPEELFLREAPRLMQLTFGLGQAPEIAGWRALADLFAADVGLFDRPVILFIDEFDKLPLHIIDRLVNLFRDMYLARSKYRLHGLALIGVRAVLGVESPRGSPFNVQRSVHVPNFTEDEVVELFRQYQEESSQTVEAVVVAEVYRVTRGQPGLVSWFGELLTMNHNPGEGRPIDSAVWEDVYRMALYREWNNTVLNIVKKAKGEYRDHVLELFARSDVEFKLDAEWCNFLYLNGIIDGDTVTDDDGRKAETCRFSSPFIQERLYNALTDDLVGDRTPILALEILDDLADVFAGETLDLPALLERYKAYLTRLEAKGIDPWKEQPRRSDLRLTEAVGHFHLYAWLRSALNSCAVVSPEFPTGNGKVDLHVQSRGRVGVIEVKSFINLGQLNIACRQAARYAASLGLDSVVLALFVPSRDEDVLQKLCGERTIDGTRVVVVPIGWAPP